ncbi:MAG: hypothetical protein AAFN08_06740 [Cyanobacteria bacterium J06559_3]
MRPETALESLRPGALWRVEWQSDTKWSLTWLDTEQTEPDQQAIAAEMARLAAIVDPDWDGFRRWRYTNQYYKALLRAEPGLMQALDDAISNMELDIARSLWEDLKSLGAITPQLGGALAEAAIEFSLPDEIKVALS